MLRRLVDFFRGQQGRPLRNRAGGMAWIVGLNEANGGNELNGRAVKTVRLAEEGFWTIEPRQTYRACVSSRFIETGEVILEGQTVVVDGIADDCLEPWKDTGLRQSEVRKLYEPSPLRVEPVADKHGAGGYVPEHS